MWFTSYNFTIHRSAARGASDARAALCVLIMTDSGHSAAGPSSSAQHLMADGQSAQVLSWDEFKANLRLISSMALIPTGTSGNCFATTPAADIVKETRAALEKTLSLAEKFATWTIRKERERKRQQLQSQRRTQGKQNQPTPKPTWIVCRCGSCKRANQTNKVLVAVRHMPDTTNHVSQSKYNRWSAMLRVHAAALNLPLDPETALCRACGVTVLKGAEMTGSHVTFWSETQRLW